jgi:hypothetical protein
MKVTEVARWVSAALCWLAAGFFFVAAVAIFYLDFHWGCGCFGNGPRWRPEEGFPLMTASLIVGALLVFLGWVAMPKHPTD